MGGFHKTVQLEKAEKAVWKDKKSRIFETFYLCFIVQLFVQ